MIKRKHHDQSTGQLSPTVVVNHAPDDSYSVRWMAISKMRMLCRCVRRYFPFQCIEHVSTWVVIHIHTFNAFAQCVYSVLIWMTIIESLGRKYNFGMTVFWSTNFNHNPICYDLNLSYSVKLFYLKFSKINQHNICIVWMNVYSILCIFRGWINRVKIKIYIPKLGHPGVTIFAQTLYWWAENTFMWAWYIVCLYHWLKWVWFNTYEVARGCVGTSTIRALQHIGLTGKQRNNDINEMSDVAESHLVGYG